MALILILLEPFPIRNTFCAHAWIGERLARMLLGEGQGLAVAEMRVACNMPTLTHLSGMVPAARPYLVGLPIQAEAPFATAMADWHSVGLAEWRAIQAGSPEHEDAYAALLDALRETYPFDVLGYWGTNETLRAAASRTGTPVLWAEYGPLRPPFPRHLCLDAEGVNGLAPARDGISLRASGAASTIPGTALSLKAREHSAYEATMVVPAAACVGIFTTLMQFAKGKREVILLALQLGDDANILAFGEGWSGKAMVEAILKLRAGPGVGFILRPHPGEEDSFHNLMAGDAARVAAQDRDDVLVFDTAGEDAYLACLSVATEVVSINSSVGFEAALLGKPIRVLGHASYMPPGGGADLSAPPAMLDDRAVAALLRDRFIPEGIFWTLACWRDKAIAVLGDRSRTVSMLPRLPTVPARVLGPSRKHDDGQLVVGGLGSLLLLSDTQIGYVDAVSERNGQLLVDGWGFDPRTGSALAGFVITTGEHSVWCAGVHHRLDVARHHRDARKLATGFVMSIAFKDMPSAMTHPVSAFGITVSGSCLQLRNQWRYQPDCNRFACVEMATA